MAAYAGFDCSGYPGDDVIRYLKRMTNFAWCGFYLGPAPSHPDAGWMTKRSFLKSLGLGLAPIYVGQQTIGPGSRNPDTSHGYQDGTGATKLMQQAGFPQNSAVYLDLENGLPFPSAQQAYVAAWVDQVEHNGYVAGVYCSHTFAAAVHQIVPSALIWSFKVDTTSPHPVPGPLYPDIHPAGCGYAGAYMWQLGQSCQIAAAGAPGGRLLVDLDTSIAPDPSSPQQALVAESAASSTAREQVVSPI